MNVTQLREQLQAALDAGLHPETEVVYARDGWYERVDDVAEHPLDGKGHPGEGYGGSVDLWFTLSPAGGEEAGVEADARFTPGHHPLPDPELHAEYLNLAENDIAFDENGDPVPYERWLQDEYEDHAGALRDDPPRDPLALAGTYRYLSALLHELHRLDLT